MLSKEVDISDNPHEQDLEEFEDVESKQKRLEDIRVSNNIGASAAEQDVEMRSAGSPLGGTPQPAQQTDLLNSDTPARDQSDTEANRHHD